MQAESKISIPNRTIERYDISADKWQRIKCQLNYNQSFASSVVCEDRYIYMFNGEKSDGVIEVLDITRENID